MINSELFIFQHYEQDADGLCTQLIKCLPKVGKQEFCVEAFVDAGWVIQEHELEVRDKIWTAWSRQIIQLAKSN
jgi:hypothetical protein